MIDAGDILGALVTALLASVIAYAAVVALERLFGLAPTSSPRRPTRFIRFGRTYLPLARAGIWFVAALIVVGLLVGQESNWIALMAALPLVIGAGLALRDYFGDVFAGMRLALERPFRRGDRIEFGGSSGTVLSLGLTQTRVRSDDGQERHLPNRRLLREGYRTIRRVERDVPVDVELPLSDQKDFTAAKEAAFRAAIVSRFVSPTQSPEVFIETSDGVVRLRVRAYVSGPALIDAFRSELIEIWLERGGR